MKIALASPPFPVSLADGLATAINYITEASKNEAAIICFPETYLPGYPLDGDDQSRCTSGELQAALVELQQAARIHKVAVIMPMDWYVDDIKYNVAQVIDADGSLLGYQTKNQLDPSEDDLWEAGTERHIFEIAGLRFGITICHEGFRYPESVRWAAMRGAQIVFHPNCTGNDVEGKLPVEWGQRDSPYYEKAQMMRAMENTIYIAASNYGFRYPDSASATIAPDGRCLVSQHYGGSGLIYAEIDVEQSSALLARRFKIEKYYH